MGITHFEREMMKIKREVDEVRTVREQLLTEMRSGKYNEGKRLPRETVLSEELGISRTQLRDTLAGLEQEGYITRKMGVGTIINRHVLNVKSRMDIEAEILDIIRNNGYEPKIIFLDASEEKADERVAEKLKIPVGTPVMQVRKLCTADGKPALYFGDIFSKELIKKEYDQEDLKYPIFQFLKEKCDVEAYMDLTQLRAVTADKNMAELLRVSEGSPLLNMEEVDYDMEGTVVLYSSQYFVDQIFEQTVLRKKL